MAATVPAQSAPDHPLADLGVLSVDGEVVAVVVVVVVMVVVFVVVVAAGRTSLRGGLEPTIACYRG